MLYFYSQFFCNYFIFSRLRIARLFNIIGLLKKTHAAQLQTEDILKILFSIISLILTVSLLLGCLGILSSCGGENGDGAADVPPSDNNGNGGDDDEIGEGGDSPVYDHTIIVPDPKDYGRGTADLDTLTYSTPSYASVIAKFTEAADSLIGDDMTDEEALDLIKSLESDYNSLLDMRALCYANYAKNTRDSYWSTEYEKHISSFASFCAAVENLYGSAARSSHKEYLEKEYFGVSLNKYLLTADYSEEALRLLGEAERLENEFATLSIATVSITYNDETLTAKEALNKYGTDLSSVSLINELYAAERAAKAKSIYIALLRIRATLAEELGYKSYTQYLYSSSLTEQTHSEAASFFSGIKNYIVPVMQNLKALGIYDYVSSTAAPKLDSVNLMNRLYYTYTDVESSILGEVIKSGDDRLLSDAYCYMLQHGLYDLGGGDNALGNGFTTYIPSNASPYIYINKTDTVSDYLTFSRELGSFIDGYVNDGLTTSPAVGELYGSAFELLTLQYIKRYLSINNYTYLKYYSIAKMTDSLLSRCIFAYFENLAYDLAFDEITEDKLDELVCQAYTFFYGTEITATNAFNSLFYSILGEDGLTTPMTIQSTAIASVAAMEIFFAEVANDGDGLAAFKLAVDRCGIDIDLATIIAQSGIDDPTGSSTLLRIANCINVYINGVEYFRAPTQLINVA